MTGGRGVHHTAIVTTDIDAALHFWQDGLGLVQLFDHVFRGDWRTLFDAGTDELRSIFLGDPEHPDSGIVELVQFIGDAAAAPGATNGIGRGFFLVSLERDVNASLTRLAALGFNEGVRQISVPAPGGKTLAMAVLTAPDGVRVELIGPPQ